MDVVFNINVLGLEGLGATLTSLIRNCSNNKELKLWFLCSDLTNADKANIQRHLQDEQFSGDTEFIDYNAKAIFGHLRSLHGDWTAYGRLLIADYITSDTALYLDADLIILLDVLSLKNFKFNGQLLAAVYGNPVKNALENQFFIKCLKWLPDTAYFNSGVILVDLKKWRSERIDQQWKCIAEKYPDNLFSHDQTLLNAVCAGRFAHLPARFNKIWYASKAKPANSDHAILHFVGSPKPWDFLGSFIHKGYSTWCTYETSFWEKQYRTITLHKVRRTWKIRRSILKNLIRI